MCLLAEKREKHASTFCGNPLLSVKKKKNARTSVPNCSGCVSRRQKRMMGMTPNEAELMDVDNHYPTDRVPMEMKEKSVAENLLEKMSETQ